MMKTLIITLAVVLLACSVSFADTELTGGTVDIYKASGWNMIALSNVPINPAPASVLTGWTIIGNLKKWDVATGANKTYTSATWGNLAIGEGYWLYNNKTTTGINSYECIHDGLADTTGGVKTDMWISLPGANNAGAWHMIGLPFKTSRLTTKIFVTDGTAVKSWKDASAASNPGGPWLASSMKYWGGTGYTSLLSVSTTASMLPNRGYWIYTNKPNIALIILGQ